LLIPLPTTPLNNNYPNDNELYNSDLSSCNDLQSNAYVTATRFMKETII